MIDSWFFLEDATAETKIWAGIDSLFVQFKIRRKCVGRRFPAPIIQTIWGRQFFVCV